MKDRPIIFRGDGVLAILECRKTQTRRVIKPQPWYIDPAMKEFYKWECGDGKEYYTIECPYGQPGDRLWCKETWVPMCRVADPFCLCDEEAAKVNHYIEYRADTGNPLPGDWPEENREDEGCPKWRSPIFMPRWASRITLEIISVRVERLQEITPVDCKAEGIFIQPPHNPGVEEALKHLGEYNRAFEKLWNSINEKRGYGWDTNCWVWVLEFKRIL